MFTLAAVLRVKCRVKDRSKDTSWRLLLHSRVRWWCFRVTALELGSSGQIVDTCGGSKWDFLTVRMQGIRESEVKVWGLNIWKKDAPTS